MSKPPYEITYKIVSLISSISTKIGELNAIHLDKPSPKLRKTNRIKTIHASLGIEGNTLSIDHITAIIENKKVVGPPKDIIEVTNAIELYQFIRDFKPFEIKSYLLAHQILTKNLVNSPGKFRSKGVGILNGNKIAHLPPPADKVPYLMQSLFNYLNDYEELMLIKSCVFHYEMEFIHPFDDGNGRIGRFWQTCLLMSEYPVFEFIPFENLIQKSQSEYYSALSKSDKLGQSTPFIEYMLGVLDEALSEYLDVRSITMTSDDRLAYFADLIDSTFTRKDYMNVFQDISAATASRDLSAGVQSGLFTKHGDKRKTFYTIVH